MSTNSSDVSSISAGFLQNYPIYSAMSFTQTSESETTNQREIGSSSSTIQSVAFPIISHTPRSESVPATPLIRSESGFESNYSTRSIVLEHFTPTPQSTPVETPLFVIPFATDPSPTDRSVAIKQFMQLAPLNLQMINDTSRAPRQQLLAFSDLRSDSEIPSPEALPPTIPSSPVLSTQIQSTERRDPIFWPPPPPSSPYQSDSEPLSPLLFPSPKVLREVPSHPPRIVANQSASWPPPPPSTPYHSDSETPPLPSMPPDVSIPSIEGLCFGLPLMSPWGASGSIASSSLSSFTPPSPLHPHESYRSNSLRRTYSMEYRNEETVPEEEKRKKRILRFTQLTPCRSDSGASAWSPPPPPPPTPVTPDASSPRTASPSEPPSPQTPTVLENRDRSESNIELVSLSIPEQRAGIPATQSESIPSEVPSVVAADITPSHNALQVSQSLTNSSDPHQLRPSQPEVVITPPIENRTVVLTPSPRGCRAFCDWVCYCCGFKKA